MNPVPKLHIIEGENLKKAQFTEKKALKVKIKDF